jgi:hypothetical protein
METGNTGKGLRMKLLRTILADALRQLAETIERSADTATITLDKTEYLDLAPVSGGGRAVRTGLPTPAARPHLLIG